MPEPLRIFGVENVDAYWQRRERDGSVRQGRLHRFLAGLIHELVEPGGNVLDCGCGAGQLFRLCLPDYKMHGVELSPHAIEQYDFPTDTIRQADLNEGVPDFGVKFDAIVASMIVHWLDDPGGFLVQATGHLKERGRLIVVIPNITYYPYRIAYLFGKFPPISLSHTNFQTPAEFEDMAASRGLRIEQRLTPKRKLRAKLWPTVFSQDVVYVLKPEVRHAQLCPTEEFPATNALYRLLAPGQPRLVKVYLGRQAETRRDRERATLLVWQEAGLKVPEVFEHPLEGLDHPYLVMTHLSGQALGSALRCPRTDLSSKLTVWQDVLATMRRRHDLAIRENQASLVHPDPNTGNVILTETGVFFVDLEKGVRDGEVRTAAAIEIAQLSRWVIRDLGIQHCRRVLHAVVDAYRGHEELLELICRRVHDRPLQFYHRWKDRHKKTRRRDEVTKYDVANALRPLLSGGDVH